MTAHANENGRFTLTAEAVRNQFHEGNRINTVPNHTAFNNPGESANPTQPMYNQNLLSLLYCIADDKAVKDGFSHRGIVCNSCGMNPICGIRYKCANCSDYDVCERCESKDNHNKMHVFLKIKIPIPSLINPRNALLSPLYPGSHKVKHSLLREDIALYKKSTHFDLSEINGLYEQFSVLTDNVKGISREVFNLCLGPLGRKANLVMSRLFKFFDRNGNGYIDFNEFVHGLSILIKGNLDEKLKYVFTGYDLDGSGYISKENLRRMFKAYFGVTIDLVRDVVKGCEDSMPYDIDDMHGKPVSSFFNSPIPVNTGPSVSSKEKVLKLPDNQSSFYGKRESMWPVMEAMSQDAIDEMVENVFRHGDLNRDGRLSFDEFKICTLTDPTLVSWFEALGTIF
ncbi:uncharacterized protein TRIADDRAFT_56938 [Trichoplax adhaerens]|uniref:Uncharacterized protein n=1 Tax=Trichoplax adhaerens TaxID=10228 RepID=B3RWZ4_TRIAD|nr:hypothetical protein TRIADDRAFT_56938 [Trichoplax adhaerens]EDV25220.1 hypothetical protein TRIADDRAFT_56938 [Trichoplax adhaerens]|eukprot:XP_002113110.1 hypothetical protein TRIADDRAFT_56938 [Trichoplax adhaerens]